MGKTTGLLYTNEELQELERMERELINWMFHRPHDSFPIRETLKEAMLFGTEQTIKKLEENLLFQKEQLNEEPTLSTKACNQMIKGELRRVQER